MNQFLAGFGAGMALGLLFAPRSGRRLRRYISEQTNELRESALDAAERGRHFVTRRIERLAAPREPGVEVYQR
jgi:gas vesicle protein